MANFQYELDEWGSEFEEKKKKTVTLFKWKAGFSGGLKEKRIIYLVKAVGNRLNHSKIGFPYL